MKVNVRYFASLREKMGKEEDAVSLSDGATVAEVWAAVSGGAELMANNTLIAVNMEYTDTEHVLTDGDEVAFFPPVTGG